MEEVTAHVCSVCSCDYTDDEGGVQGEFGILPVSFCPTCLSCMCDMAAQFREAEAEDEDEITPEQAEFLEHLRGVTRVVINRCYGGFGLSFAGKIAYLDRAGVAYTLEPQADRDTQNRLGPRILVDDAEFSDRTLDRSDPALVSVVRDLEAAAAGPFAELRIVKIPADVDWEIADHDGREWVAEAHRRWR